MKRLLRQFENRGGKKIAFVFSFLLISVSWLLAVPDSVPAQRIVTLDSGTDTLVLQLADLEDILAVRERTQDPTVSLQWEKAREVRGLKREMAEEVYAMKPDLVFFGQWSGYATREMLNKLGVPVVRLKSPKTWDEVYENIRQVGDLVGHPDRADAMIKSMQTRLTEVKQKIQNYPRKRAVFYVGRGSTYGSKTRQDMVMRSAGLINLSAENGIEGLGNLSVEELLLENPDLIIFSDYKKDVPTLSRQILDHPAFEKLKASQVVLTDVPSNRINCLDEYLVDCVEQLARTVYPQAFEETSELTADAENSSNSIGRDQS